MMIVKMINDDDVIKLQNFKEDTGIHPELCVMWLIEMMRICFLGSCQRESSCHESEPGDEGGKGFIKKQPATWRLDRDSEVSRADHLIPDLSQVTSERDGFMQHWQLVGWTCGCWLLLSVCWININQIIEVCVSGSIRDQTGQSLSPAVCLWRVTGPWILPWTLKMDAALPIEGENSWNPSEDQNLVFYVPKDLLIISVQPSCPHVYLLCCGANWAGAQIDRQGSSDTNVQNIQR